MEIYFQAMLKAVDEPKSVRIQNITFFYNFTNFTEDNIFHICSYFLSKANVTSL